MGLGRPVIWAFVLGFGIGQARSTTSLPLLQGENAGVGSAAEDERRPTVAILVDDVVDLPSTTLGKAEAIATDIFRQAGVQVSWTICSLRQAEHRDAAGCQLSLDAPTIIVKILPNATGRRWGLPVNRLGFCVDKDVYLLMPRISGVAERQAVPISLVLGHALVHEVGHVLLGAGHSQGVMRADFRKTDWRQAEKGQFLFVANDAHRIRAELVKLARDESLRRAARSCAASPRESGTSAVLRLSERTTTSRPPLRMPKSLQLFGASAGMSEKRRTLGGNP
jgi:hypothetical protein